VMKVKVYDKILELVGRDGARLVGSRVNQVVGAVRNSDMLQTKIRKAQKSGLTRLEISFCFSNKEN